MSGTSLDAVSTVIVEFEDEKFKVVGFYDKPIDGTLKQQLLDLIFKPITIEQYCDLEQLFTENIVEAVSSLLQKYSLTADSITAIGCHGQTIWHRPKTAKQSGITLQMGNHNYITERTNITTVADFRRRDIAAGGQGAPLAPAFHKKLLADLPNAAILNIGGIANISLYRDDGKFIGFDSGPGNMLIDILAKRHLDKNYDDNGSWAKTGQVDEQLLQNMLANDYFAKQPPKSTGRELFNESFIERYANNRNISPTNLQATILQLTVESVAAAIPSSITTIYVCGGGSQNQYLMQKLQQRLQRLDVFTTEQLGISPNLMECLAFAWLARQTLKHKPANIPTVTGALAARILGTICYNK